MAGIEGLGVDPEVARAFIVQEKPKEPKPKPLRAVPDAGPPAAVEPSREDR